MRDNEKALWRWDEKLKRDEGFLLRKDTAFPKVVNFPSAVSIQLCCALFFLKAGAFLCRLRFQVQLRKAIAMPQQIYFANNFPAYTTKARIPLSTSNPTNNTVSVEEI